MPRTVRAFSLDLNVQLRMEKLLSQPGECGLDRFMPTESRPPTPAPPEEEFIEGLRRSDYDALYDKLGAASAKRKYTQQELQRHIQRATPSQALTTFMARTFREAKAARAKAERSAKLASIKAERDKLMAQIPIRRRSVSVSRAVEVLLTLGMDKLEEMGHSGHEVAEGNKTNNVGGSQAQSARTRARKATAA